MTTNTLASYNNSNKISAPKIRKRKDDRVILHFDYDCFYASVFENENPVLKAQPLGVKQKSILATCNYVARAKGVKKLMLISDAQKICPELVLVNGEDLTRFRDVSKKLWLFLRSHSWNKQVERLGLDEVFLDVSDIITYNAELLNRNALSTSFFQLSETDPEKGFPFDASKFFGFTYPSGFQEDQARWDDPLFVRLLVASHLAGYLRLKIEEDFGYTSTCGVYTNKLLAKMVGNKHKPKNQTTLLGYDEQNIQDFLDPLQIRKIPGIGGKTSQLIEDHVLGRDTDFVSHSEEHAAKVTRAQVLAHDGMSAELLERVLGRPGSERGIGEKVWGLLQGIDDTEVKAASDVPTQISIEDTYQAKPLNSPAELMRELHALTTSLVRRMRVDLVVDDEAEASEPANKKWLAHPRTMRLSTRTRPKPGAQLTAAAERESFSRNSRSQPVPNLVFSLQEGVEHVAERLVAEAVLPLFRKLHSERQGWNLSLINICVTNMALTGNDEGTGGGRDISHMFRTQEDKLREWTVYDQSPVVEQQQQPPPSQRVDGVAKPGNIEVVEEEMDSEEEEDSQAIVWEDGDGSQVCQFCGCSMPIFAVAAHERFHTLGH